MYQSYALLFCSILKSFINYQNILGVGKSLNNEQMIEAGLLKILGYLSQKRWGDEDIEEDIAILDENLQKDLAFLSYVSTFCLVFYHVLFYSILLFE